MKFIKQYLQNLALKIQMDLNQFKIRLHCVQIPGIDNPNGSTTSSSVEIDPTGSVQIQTTESKGSHPGNSFLANTSLVSHNPENDHSETDDTTNLVMSTCRL